MACHHGIVPCQSISHVLEGLIALLQGQPAAFHLRCVATLSIPNPPRPACTAPAQRGPSTQQGRLQTVLSAAPSPAQWHHQILQVLLAGLHE